ncbi:MAG: acyl-CoA dehydrogenase family protein [candidate division WOR-3 bacterium]
MFFRFLDYIEDQEHKVLRDNVRKFVESEIASISKKMDEEDFFPIDLFKKMGKLGFTGILIPEEYGGIGEDVLSAIIVLEEISKESPALALSLLAHNILCAYPIVKFGNKEQKDYYLPKLANAEFIGGLAYTEPNAGSDAENITTKAILEGDYFYISGSKNFITNGSIADVLILYARTGQEGKDGISAFIFDTKSRGFYVSKKLNKLGMRGSPTALLYFDNVKISKDKLLGQLNRGYYMVVKGFEIERITISAISIGIAIRCVEWMVKYSKERKAFSRPISEFQLIQEKVARISSKLEVLRTYLYLSAKYYNPEKDNRVNASTLKYLCGKLGVEAGLEAIQVLGGYGYTKDYIVEKLMRDAKLNDIGAGTTEMMILQLSKMAYRYFK